MQFAKHFKVEEQVSFLQKTRTGIAVGTPQRLIDLIENGTQPPIKASPLDMLHLLTPEGIPVSTEALCLENVKRIVVDASHIDQKKRGIVDMRETMLPLAKLLCRAALKERYEDDTARHVDLLFY